jgi:hypothetical protein
LLWRAATRVIALVSYIHGCAAGVLIMPTSETHCRHIRPAFLRFQKESNSSKRERILHRDGSGRPSQVCPVSDYQVCPVSSMPSLSGTTAWATPFVPLARALTAGGTFRDLTRVVPCSVFSVQCSVFSVQCCSVGLPWLSSILLCIVPQSESNRFVWSCSRTIKIHHQTSRME